MVKSARGSLDHGGRNHHKAQRINEHGLHLRRHDHVRGINNSLHGQTHFASRVRNQPLATDNWDLSILRSGQKVGTVGENQASDPRSHSVQHRRVQKYPKPRFGKVSGPSMSRVAMKNFLVMHQIQIRFNTYSITPLYLTEIITTRPSRSTGKISGHASLPLLMSSKWILRRGARTNLGARSARQSAFARKRIKLNDRVQFRPLLCSCSASVRGRGPLPGGYAAQKMRTLSAVATHAESLLLTFFHILDSDTGIGTNGT